MSEPTNEKKTMPDQLDFLNYVSKLKHLDRTGWVRMGIKKPETIAGHMYRMGIMSAFLVDDPTIDLNKCVKMSLVHDLGESIVGDIIPSDGVDVKVKYNMEVAAIDKLAGFISHSKGDEIRSLFQEYEDSVTPEAKLVKDLDRFDMILQAYEYEQAENKPKSLQEFFDSTKEFFHQSHPKVKDLVSKLYEARDANIPFSQK